MLLTELNHRHHLEGIDARHHLDGIGALDKSGAIGVSNFAQLLWGRARTLGFRQTGGMPNQNQLGSRKALSMDRSGWRGCRYVPLFVWFSAL
jgi:hypothetical protein